MGNLPTAQSSAGYAGAGHSALASRLSPSNATTHQDPSSSSPTDPSVNLIGGSSALQSDPALAQHLPKENHRDDGATTVAGHQRQLRGPPTWLRYHNPPSLSQDIMNGYAEAHKLSCNQRGIKGHSNGTFKEVGSMKAIAIAKYVVPFRISKRETIPRPQEHSTKMAYYKSLSAEERKAFELYAMKEIEKLFSDNVREQLASLRRGVGTVGDTDTRGINAPDGVRTVDNTSNIGRHGTRIDAQDSGVVHSPVDPSHGNPSASAETSSTHVPRNTLMGPQPQSPSSSDLVDLLSAPAPAAFWSTASGGLSPRAQLDLANQIVDRQRNLVKALRVRESLEENNLQAAIMVQEAISQSYTSTQNSKLQENSKLLPRRGEC